MSEEYPLSDPVEFLPGSKDERPADDCRGRQTGLLERIPGQHFVGRSGLNDERLPLLTEAVDLAIASPGGRREVAAAFVDPLLAVDFRARAGVIAREESLIQKNVDLITIDDRRRIVGGRRGQGLGHGALARFRE